jgi:hypothetical protein
MTGPWLGVLLGAVGAGLALTAVCGPWWATYLRSRHRMHRQLADVLHDAESRRRAAASGLFAINPEETDPS